MHFNSWALKGIQNQIPKDEFDSKQKERYNNFEASKIIDRVFVYTEKEGY